MALAPITFSRPSQRQPGLVEQAFVSLLASYAGDKLIGQPRERREEARTLATEDRAREFSREMWERQQDAASSDAIRQYENASRLHEESLARGQVQAEENAPELGSLGVIENRLSGLFGLSENAIDLSGGTRQAGTATVGLMERLAGLAQREREAAGNDRDWLLNLAAQVSAQDRQLPPVLIQEEDGSYRLPNQEENQLRTLGRAGTIANVAGYENDPRVRRLQQRSRELEARLISVPAYDPEQELQLLGQVTGDAVGTGAIAFREGLIGILQGADLVGADKSWYRNDAGETVRVQNEAQLLTGLAAQARGRLRGALWSQVYFQSPGSLERAKAQYGLHDAAAEQTWALITGGALPEQAPQQGTRGTGATESVTGGAGAASPPRRPPLATQTAQRFLDEAPRAMHDDFRAWAEDFSDPAEGLQRYLAEKERLETLFALPDEGFADRAQQMGFTMDPGSEPGSSPRQPGSQFAVSAAERARMERSRAIAQRDRLRLDVMRALEVARIESAHRRAQR